MKKMIIFLFIFILSAGMLSASKKDVVYFGNLTHSSSIGESETLAIRNKVMAGLMKPDRIVIKDVNSEAALKSHEQKVTEDASKVDGSALSIMKNLQANYLIQGHVQTLEVVKSTSSEGSVSYSASLAFSLQVVDVADETVTATQTFNYSGLLKGGSGSTPETAFANSMHSIESDMKAFIDEYFPLTGSILEISKESKGKAQEVYIDLGSVHGVQKGQKFEVYLEREIAGRKALNKVGELQTEAVEAGDLSRCKVNGAKTQEAIKQAMGEGTNIVIKSIYRKSLMDSAGGFGKGLIGL